MSGGLAPSKSTVYVSNLPFSLTNNDLHKILEKYGKVVKVTIVKDKTTRRSKGVAFVLFLEREAAHKSCHALHKTVMFGRTINCSIARDNGRTVEFIRRKEYTDKSKCYECGEEGHLSYKCPKNLLGERDQPKKKDKKRKKEHGEEGESSGEEDTGEDPKEDSLAAAIKFQAQQEKSEMDGTPVYSAGLLASYSGASFDDDEPKKKKYKKDAYFSDEEELGEEQGDDD